MIAAAPKLKLIQKIGIGVNTIDLEAAKARGIPVCNLPGTNSRAVAELTLALMLAALRRLPRFDAGLRGGAVARSAAAGWHSANWAGAWSGWSAMARSRGCWRRCWRRWAAGVLYTDRAPVADAVGEWRAAAMRCWRRPTWSACMCR